VSRERSHPLAGWICQRGGGYAALTGNCPGKIVMEDFTKSVIEIIQRIPQGKVCTYGLIALMAGHPRGARQVTRILHTMSRKYDLPWHRVINARGCISLAKYGGYEEQKARLELEGVAFDEQDRIDLDRFLWKTGTKNSKGYRIGDRECR